jgi:Putative Ig domain
MARSIFYKHARYRRCFIAIVAAVTWCTVSAAYGAGSAHWQDQVTISGSPASNVTTGQAYSFTPSASATSGRSLVFAITNKPSWATFSSSTGQLSGTPSVGSVGAYSNIVIGVSDGWKSATLPAFGIQVMASTNTGPSTPPLTISGTPPTNDVAGNAYSFQPTANGGGATRSFSAQNKPAWANFSIATGLLSGTPSSAQTGTYPNIVVSVSDGVSSSALTPFSITVSAATASSPTVSLSASPSTISSGSASTLSWSSTNATSCSASGGWSGSEPTSGSASTGGLSATTTYTLSCSGSGGSASQSVTVSVSAPPPNPAVSLSASPSSVSSGTASTLTWSSAGRAVSRRAAVRARVC